ncbi:MAG: ribosome recycling factor [Candidatus Jorgensenbacteria bacterium]|nr:ribosome recycling factor [Candidatus Jorgensenbacteria bacterium]
MEAFEIFKTQLAKFLEDVKRELSSVRTNRPHAGLVEDIKVHHYGGVFPVKQLGSVGVMPPREIRVEVWDREATSAVAKAIETSSLGLSANTEGNVIRIFLPELSLERRRELTKYVSQIVEEHRIKVRHARDEANKKIHKLLDDGEITEDQKFKLKEDVQKATDAWNKSAETAMETKAKEIQA